MLTLGAAPRQNRSTIRARAKAKIDDIDGRIAALRAMKRTLNGLVNQCERCGASTDRPIVASLDQDGVG